MSYSRKRRHSEVEQADSQALTFRTPSYTSRLLDVGGKIFHVAAEVAVVSTLTLVTPARNR